jgi:hypothetical protein
MVQSTAVVSDHEILTGRERGIKRIPFWFLGSELQVLTLRELLQTGRRE